MKKKIIHFSLIVVAFATVVVACLNLDVINIDQPQSDGTMAPRIEAGQVATFVVEGHLAAIADAQDGRRLILGMLAPRSWDIANNCEVSVRGEAVVDVDHVYTMKVIPNSTQPKSMQGRSWPEALMERFGLGPNLYNDMEWVAWQAEEAVPITNGDNIPFDITIKCKVGDENLKACLGFVINHDDDGLSSDEAHFKYSFSDPFTVYGGEGEEIDYTQVRFNSVTPSRSLQDDIITFTFSGDAFENRLIEYEEIFFECKAVTEAGVEYPGERIQMVRENTFTHTYNCTLWPGGHFNVPEDEKIVAIEYEFVNADGSERMNKLQEIILSGGTPTPEVERNPDYTFNLRCE